MSARNLKERIILSLGGSLVVPQEIDVEFLKRFKECLEEYLDKKSFFVLVGGGRVCRMYQRVFLEFGGDAIKRDWIGIKISRLNAEILQQVFYKFSYPKILTNPLTRIKTNKEIIIGAGWKPGWSTDYDAVLVAKVYKIKTVVNLTNIDYVYDKDPRKYPNAKIIKRINWQDFRKIVGEKWEPGLSTPFDPKAAKLAEKLKLRVIILNGQKMENFKNFLERKEFEGTIIE